MTIEDLKESGLNYSVRVGSATEYDVIEVEDGRCFVAFKNELLLCTKEGVLLESPKSH